MRRVNHITADIAGSSVEMRLERSEAWVDIIEHWLGSPLALYHKMLANGWSVDDVAFVLKLAHTPSSDRSILNVPEVDDWLEGRGAGTYVILAVKLLEAYLFGVEPGDATFTDREAA